MTKSGCSIFHLLYPNAVPSQPRGMMRLLGGGTRSPRKLPEGTPLALAYNWTAARLDGLSPPSPLQVKTRPPYVYAGPRGPASAAPRRSLPHANVWRCGDAL